MDPGFLILLLIFFVIVPLIEAIMRKNRAAQKAPDVEETSGAAGPRPEYNRPHGTTAQRRTSTVEQGADEMIPDDLWELLTGEQRQHEPEDASEYDPVAWEPEPELDPEPAYARYEPKLESAAESEPDYARSDPETVSAWRRTFDPPPLPAPPVRAPEPAPPLRAAPARRARPAQVASPARTLGEARKRLGISSRDEVRRAIVLREVLGTPRGLSPLRSLEDDPIRR